MTSELSSREIDSPLGILTLRASAHGLRAVLWGSTNSTDNDADPETSAVLDLTESQLGEYFAGDRRDFALPLDPKGTTFQLAAWEALKKIPYGETITYGEQATRLNNPKAMRAVGAANGANPIPIIVPCHRVIGADGSLTGFASGLDSKRWLHNHEAPTLF
ncbi:MAG: methylated-DNA--[protein]-cysteine S-methyltransferase [Acidimicrobiales bacterium]